MKELGPPSHLVHVQATRGFTQHDRELNIYTENDAQTDKSVASLRMSRCCLAAGSAGHASASTSAAFSILLPIHEIRSKPRCKTPDHHFPSTSPSRTCRRNPRAGGAASVALMFLNSSRVLARAGPRLGA